MLAETRKELVSVTEAVQQDLNAILHSAERSTEVEDGPSEGQPGPGSDLVSFFAKAVQVLPPSPSPDRKEVPVGTEDAREANAGSGLMLDLCSVEKLRIDPSASGDRQARAFEAFALSLGPECDRHQLAIDQISHIPTAIHTLAQSRAELGLSLK